VCVCVPSCVLRKVRGIDPDIVCFNAALSAAEKGSQWEHALELLGELVSHPTLHPTSYSYTVAIKVFDAA